MTDSIQDPECIQPAASLRDDLGAMAAWLDTPVPSEAADDLVPLLAHLATLRTSQTTPQLRALTLERLYGRSLSVLDALRPSLTDASLPLPRHVRLLVRHLQELLRSLAEDLLATPNMVDGHLIRGLREQQARLLQNCLYALSQHLLISDLVASPAGSGVWPLLHKTYAMARRLKVTRITPEGSSCTLQNLYHSALLLGCAQPASFTSREVEFVADFLDRFSDQIEWFHEAPEKLSATFWIDPAHDVAAFACARKSAPTDRPVDYFSCDKLTELLKSQLVALGAGCSASDLNLPTFAETTAGRGVLRRLVAYWGDPDKRRFPRRRQNYRALLCAGLDGLWRLFHNGEDADIETSSWMITNESPDGYAVMHVSGKPGRMSVGDVTAMRTESGTDWKICIIRWALSENQVHFELGLQILATNAVAAFLVQANDSNTPSRLPVLVLPEVPAIRSSEMMIVRSGALASHDQNHVLVFEKQNIAVREVRSTGVDEQNSQIEVFSITPDMLADDESS